MSHQPQTTAAFTALKCPNCNSTDLKKVSLIHATGTYESRGGIWGILAGSHDGLLFGKYRGTSQSHLSKTERPPGKLPYAAPTILWLVGFFMLMAYIGRGKLSGVMATISAAYVFLLPASLIWVFGYNLFVHPKKYRTWLGKFMCQRCGALVSTATPL
jgi:hypothetical protein